MLYKIRFLTFDFNQTIFYVNSEERQHTFNSKKIYTNDNLIQSYERLRAICQSL